MAKHVESLGGTDTQLKPDTNYADVEIYETESSELEYGREQEV